MWAYAGLAIAGLVVFGAATAALMIIRRSSKEAGAASEAKAAIEAANAGLAAELEREQKQAEIVSRETSKDETVNNLRNGSF